MKITFVQSDEEKAESDQVIRAWLSRRKNVKAGMWILPPGLSANGRFVAVDSLSTRGDVLVESFDTIDGALLWALGICETGPGTGSWDREGALKDRGNFV